MDPRFTLPELVTAAERALAHAPAPADERVSPAPDARTIRWYQTSGLLDRPLRYDGRTAVYGWRHLLQAVAVKLLQGQGRPLADVQRGLAGASTEALEAAVAEAVGADTLDALRAGAVPAPAAPVAPPPAAALVAVEVAPGVTLLVDPRTNPDPAAVIARVQALFPNGGPR